MREKRGREEKAAVGRWADTQDLPEMRRGILHPEPRCGTAAKMSLLARPDQCRISLELGLWLIEREVVVGEKERKVNQTKGRVRSCAIWLGQRDLISLSDLTRPGSVAYNDLSDMDGSLSRIAYWAAIGAYSHQ